MDTSLYSNPLFLEQERDKLTHVVVDAFSDYLSQLPQDAKYCRFLSDKGFYEGSYAENVAQPPKPYAKPKAVLTLDGKPQAAVPSLAVHAWSAMAINPVTDPKASSEAGFLKDMTREVSACISNNDLNGALSILYRDEWSNYQPSIDVRQQPRSKRS